MYGIPVVFDTNALSREDAANVVANAIGMANPNTPVGHTDHYGDIESWWFPEPQDKHVDLNDNDDMALVPVDLLENLVNAYDNGEADNLGHDVDTLRSLLGTLSTVPHAHCTPKWCEEAHEPNSRCPKSH